MKNQIGSFRSEFWITLARKSTFVVKWVASENFCLRNTSWHLPPGVEGHMLEAGDENHGWWTDTPVLWSYNRYCYTMPQSVHQIWLILPVYVLCVAKREWDRNVKVLLSLKIHCIVSSSHCFSPLLDQWRTSLCSLPTSSISTLHLCHYLLPFIYSSWRTFPSTGLSLVFYLRSKVILGLQIQSRSIELDSLMF